MALNIKEVYENFSVIDITRINVDSMENTKDHIGLKQLYEKINNLKDKIDKEIKEKIKKIKKMNIDELKQEEKTLKIIDFEVSVLITNLTNAITKKTDMSTIEEITLDDAIYVSLFALDSFLDVYNYRYVAESVGLPVIK